ncbi:MAG: DNA recombination protein RmuC [Bacteroidota bacterium]|nr:DNA recombination protein RmuC [Bacteroidota bacterium]
MTTEILYLLAGLAIGLILFLIYKMNAVSKTSYEELRQSHQDTKTQLSILQDQNTRLKESFTDTKDRLDIVHAENTALISQKIALQTNLENIHQQVSTINKELSLQKELNQKQHLENTQLDKHQSEIQANNKFLLEKLQTQKQEIEDFRKQSQIEFQNIANKILEEKSLKFTQSNKENIDSILKPLGENIDSFKKKVEEAYDKESKERFSLDVRVKELIEQSNKLSHEANNLASALKGQSKKQGNWGEIILESILEKSGLQKNREYFIQGTLKDDNGNILRPDVMIQLPEKRTIIIDSKVSLVDYDKFCSSDDKEDQDRHLKNHRGSIYKHIQDLSSKKYDSLASSLDFTMMFIPIEPAYMLAIQEDQDLWSYAYNKSILLISPTNLIAALKLIADLWRRESQSQNAIEIAKQGEKLYSKFISFAENMELIGKHITKTQEVYSDAIKQLRDGKGNLVDQAMKLKKLGVSSTKELPNTLISFDTNEEDGDEENPAI